MRVADKRPGTWAAGPLLMVIVLGLGLGLGCDEKIAQPDTVPPTWVTDLATSNPTRTSVDLTWTASGDDWNEGRASAYDLRFAQGRDSLTSRWIRTRTFPIGRAPRNAGSAETTIVRGLEPGTKYYFAIKVADEASNWSEISNIVSRTTVAAPDTIAPETIDDLRFTRATSSFLELTWTAPGDEGDLGRPSNYDLRYSTVPDTVADWWEEQTDIVTDVPIPSTPGSPETYTLAGLHPETIYYIGIRSSDPSGNISDLSNVLFAPTEREEVAVLRVLADGSGDYATIQEALDAAYNGDTIQLEAGGVYGGEGNRDLDFHGKAVTLRSQSAEQAIIDCGGTMESPHRAITFASFEGDSTIIESISFRNGVAPSGELPEEAFGGAVLCVAGSSPTFLNCDFSSNRALYGGGVFAAQSAPRFRNCTFGGNRATAGGGALYNSGSISFGEGHLVLEECAFTANQSDLGGGALVFSNGCDPVVSGCAFADNESVIAGAVKCQSGVVVTFDDCEFSSNRAAGVDYPSGGALHLHENVAATFHNCRFLENIAGDEAGAVYCTDHSPTGFFDCEFSGNAATTGAVLVCWGSSEPQLVGCTLYGNPSDEGSAAIVCTGESAPLLERTLIALNPGGAALLMDSTSLGAWLTCCDLFGNDGGDWLGSLASQLGQDGNVSIDPMFCDPAEGNLGLQPGSPCLETVSGCGRIGAFGVGCE